MTPSNSVNCLQLQGHDAVKLYLLKFNITASIVLSLSALASKVRTFSLVMNFSTDEELAALQLFQDYPRALLQFAAVCCILFMIVGIPGNLIAIIALSRCKKVRNATAIFIINLSCCDLIYCCFCLPLAASTFITESWPHGVLLCRLFPLMRFGLAAVSLFTILAITLNRYIMMSHPRFYPKLYKDRNLAIMVATIWIFPFIVLIPTWFGEWGRFGMNTSISYCAVLEDENGRSPSTLLFLLAFVIPCVTILICYTRIFFIVRKATANSRTTASNNVKRRTILEDSSFGTSIVKRFEDTENGLNHVAANGHVVSLREGTSPSSSSLSSDRTPASPTRTSAIANGFRRTVLYLKPSQADRPLPSSKDKRLLTMISAIMISFIICYLPITVLKLSHRITSYPEAYIFSYLFRYMITCINPIIYVAMSKEYRKTYKKGISQICCR